MKGLLLFLLALVVWCIGGTLTMLIGDLWFKWIFQNASTTWGYLWRWAVFSPVHMIVLWSTYYVIGFALIISPYRKTIATITIITSVINLWGSVTDLGVGNSMLVHVVANLIAIYLGVFGLISKAPYIPFNQAPQEQV